MSDQQSGKLRSSLNSPQVMAAVIGGIVTLMAALVGILPNLLDPPPEATAVVIITVTQLPTQVEATIAPTEVPSTDAAPTNETILFVPTATPVPAAPTLPAPTVSQPANALLVWDEASFTAINQSGGRLSFAGVTFAGGGRTWDARAWGPSLYNNVPARACLRLRDTTAGQRNPPPECGDLYGLILVGATAIFWRGVDSFDVLRDGVVIATCPVAAGRCEVHLPQG